jgi:hypothetical protein
VGHEHCEAPCRILPGAPRAAQRCSARERDGAKEQSERKRSEANEKQGRQRTLCRFPPALGLVLKNGHSLWKNSLSNAAVATSPNPVSSARITFAGRSEQFCPNADAAASQCERSPRSRPPPSRGEQENSWLKSGSERHEKRCDREDY